MDGLIEAGVLAEDEHNDQDHVDMMATLTSSNEQLFQEWNNLHVGMNVGV